MKRILCALICAALLFSCAFADEAGKTFVIEGESGVFSKDTATAILALSLAQDESGARDVFSGLGLEIAFTGNYDKPISDPSHTSGYCVGAGKALVRGEERSVIIAVVRGTLGGEWYSNFDFADETGGSGVYADNFMAAARDIYGPLSALISETENPVVVVTGYSRGAAVANLLGVLLDAEYDSQDIYVYTFATPNTVLSVEREYPNIFNIVNADDPTAYMPLPQWGYFRAGTDIVLDNPDVTNAQMNEILMAVLGLAPDIDAYYNRRYSLTAPGLDDGGMTTCELFQMIAVFMAKDGSDATFAAQKVFMQIMSGESDFKALTGLFVGAFQAQGEANLFAQHMPAIYVSLLLTY